MKTYTAANNPITYYIDKTGEIRGRVYKTSLGFVADYGVYNPDSVFVGKWFVTDSARFDKQSQAHQFMHKHHLIKLTPGGVTK